MRYPLNTLWFVSEQIMRGGVQVCTVQIYLLGGEQRAAQYMVEFLRGQVRYHKGGVLKRRQAKPRVATQGFVLFRIQCT